MGLAAVCAGRRWPAREIATRELRSEWSISRPALALPPPTSTAPWPCRRPRAPQPGSPVSPVPSTPVGPVVLRTIRLVSRRALALPPPTGTAAWPSGPSGTLHTSGACCAADDSPRLEARPGPAAADQHRGPPCHRPRAPWQVPRPLWHRGQARRSLRRSPVVCVFWIGSSVVDRNGASG